jgi:16S rRNA (cytidine1402-2'-O)-methyltransferase
MTGRLFLVPNLLGVSKPDDVLPQRTLAIARGLRHFAVETPKAARAFFKTLAFEVPIAELAVCEIPAAQISIGWLRAGHDVGIVSDAGCPGIADPGASLVAIAHREGINVIPLVGPSSILLALMASGLNGQSFRFHGYLPAAAAARDARLRALDAAIRANDEAQIFIETPYRNRPMLEALVQTLSKDTTLCVAQNLSCEGERIISQAAQRWTSAQIDAMGEKEPTIFLIGRSRA